MIRICYQLRSEDEPRWIELTAEEYFDPLQTGESHAADGIPRFHHAYEYTPHSADELKWTVLENGPIDGSVIRTQFLDGRRSLMTHRIDADGHEELIHSAVVGEGGLLVVRTCRRPGESWAVTSSNYSVNDSIGVSLHRGWSFADMQAFGKIGAGPARSGRGEL